MVAGGEGLKARIRMQSSRELDRRQERQIVCRSEDAPADLRRLAERRQPQSSHLHGAMDMNRPKDGLALGGGRARGLTHSGVLMVFKALPEERLREARQG